MITTKHIFMSAAILAAIAMSAPVMAKGRSGGSGPHYGGGHHTTSHGGNYSGGSGSSHRGGNYKNTNTGNKYGKHK